MLEFDASTNALAAKRPDAVKFNKFSSTYKLLSIHTEMPKVVSNNIEFQELERVMDNEVSSQQQIAMKIAKSATQIERDAIKTWFHELLEIRDSNISKAEKTKKALGSTMTNKVAWPIAKLIFGELKLNLWDNRGLQSRGFLVAASAALATVGGGTAGIAALGTAVAVPLWIVFGAGGLFAVTVLQELGVPFGKEQQQDTFKSTYTVMDAEKQ